MTKLEFSEKGYNKAEEIVSAIRLMGGEAWIDETWMDYGAEIKWQTILAYSPKIDMDYQILHPVEFDKMNNGTITTEEVREIIFRVMDRYRTI